MRARTLLAAMVGCVVLIAGTVLATWTAIADPGADPDASVGENRWIKLADRQVGRGLETEIVEIGRQAGVFERLKLSVTGADLLVHEVRVYFPDGDMQRVNRGDHVARDAQSSSYALEGAPRPIARIELTYKGRPSLSGRTAAVTVWGEANPIEPTPSTRASLPPDEGWELLGKQTVGPDVTHTVIPIGRSGGRFAAVRLQVLRNDVAFHDIRVIYLDGEVDTLAVRRLVRAGDESPPLPLNGTARLIREIELVHEADPQVKAPAIVQIWGRRSDRREDSSSTRHRHENSGG